MPLDPTLLFDRCAEERREWATRLRGGSVEVAGLARALGRATDDAGLVGPAGVALHDLGRELGRELVALGDAVARAADQVLAAATVRGPR